MEIPRLPLDNWTDAAIDFLKDNFAPITKGASEILGIMFDALVGGLMWVPPWALIPIFALLAWWLATRRVALFTLLSLSLLWNVGLWDATITTVALVLVSTLICIIFGVPLGILAALYESVYKVMMPILDFMQTMPAFVYLIPAISFFGLGAVPAIVATVIFAMPPAIRLTCLGIRQVPKELTEAADAFGATRMQKLLKVQLPMSKPTMMAGINQTIMLALSMVVIAAMIGAKGLGGEVWRAIQRLQPGMGFVAGLGVVIVAIILDRITQKLGAKTKQ